MSSLNWIKCRHLAGALKDCRESLWTFRADGQLCLYHPETAGSSVPFSLTL